MESESQLVIVFAPALWPYRLGLDRACWWLAEGMAAMLSTAQGLVGYATPMSLAGAGSTAVYRSLPSGQRVRREADALGATWAITGRLLMDAHRIELWLNLLDGNTAVLLRTVRLQPSPQRMLWALADALSRLTTEMGLDETPDFSGRDLVGTGSWQAFLAYSRASEWTERAESDAALRLRAVSAASRAVALDPKYAEAEKLLRRTVSIVLKASRNIDECDVLKAALGEHSRNETIRELRREAHVRSLALANRTPAT